LQSTGLPHTIQEPAIRKSARIQKQSTELSPTKQEITTRSSARIRKRNIEQQLPDSRYHRETQEVPSKTQKTLYLSPSITSTTPPHDPSENTAASQLIATESTTVFPQIHYKYESPRRLQPRNEGQTHIRSVEPAIQMNYEFGKAYRIRHLQYTSDKESEPVS
jgi:hypothetical protein